MRFYVDDHGAKGPFGLDELTQMVQSGKLTAKTSVVLEGHSAWQPAAIALPALFPTKKRTGLIIVLLVTLVVIGVAVALAFWRPWQHDAVLDDDFLRAALPSNVSQVSVSPSMNEIAGAADIEQISASAYAPLCGGTDVARELVAAEGKSLVELEQSGGLSLLSRPGLREGLLCGRSLAAGAAGKPLSIIGTPDDELSVVVFQSPHAAIAHGREHSFSGLSGSCIPMADDDATCDPELLALANNPPWWAWGRSERVSDFARDWVREDRSETSNMEIARVLLSAMRPGMSTRSFIKPDELDIFLRIACIHGAGIASLADCFPADVGDSIDRVEAHSRGFGWQHGDVFAEPRLQHIYYFISRDERDSEDVRTELDSLLRDWRAHLENHEPQIVEHIRESDNDHVDFDESMFRAFMRAVQESELDVDGRIVTWRMDTELTESEQREVRRRQEALRTKHEAVGRILDAIMVEETPDMADLALVLGDAAAEWMLMPRADAETCEAIRAHLAELIAAGVPTREFGARFRQEQRFSAGRCIGLPMPDEIRTCILEAPGFEAMAECKIPSVEGALR